MLNDSVGHQSEIELVNIEDLVPQDHILRKFRKHIDFSFILEKTKKYYCLDNGRPPIHPIRLFKMILIGYLFGIRSERQLMREIQVNIAYRWFLDLGLTEKVPHHSIFSQNRRRRFTDSRIFEEIFVEVVKIGIEKGFIDGKILFTDSTHLKANANKNKFKPITVNKTPKKYLSELDEAIQEDRRKHNKKPLPPKSNEEPGTKEIKSSTTDPDSGFMTRDGKPQGFFYLGHRTVDSKLNMITDVHVTPGNAHDSVCYIDRLDYQRELYGFDVMAVGLDAGYNNANIDRELCNRNIFGVIGYKRPGGKKGFFNRRKFKYVKEQDHYVCPNGKTLKYRTTNRVGYKEYISDPCFCATCPYLSKCTESKNHQKVLTRHVWEEYKEKIDKNRLTFCGKQIYKRRKETVERSFADAKQLHGYRYARYRGIEKVKEQAYMTAIAQNLKKIVNILEKWSYCLKNFILNDSNWTVIVFKRPLQIKMIRGDNF